MNYVVILLFLIGGLMQNTWAAVPLPPLIPNHTSEHFDATEGHRRIKIKKEIPKIKKREMRVNKIYVSSPGVTLTILETKGVGTRTADYIFNNIVILKETDPDAFLFLLNACHGNYAAPIVVGYECENFTLTKYYIRYEKIPGRIFRFETLLKGWDRVKTTLLKEAFPIKIGQTMSYCFTDCFAFLTRAIELNRISALYKLDLITSDKINVYIPKSVIEVIKGISTYNQKMNQYFLPLEIFAAAPRPSTSESQRPSTSESIKSILCEFIPEKRHFVDLC